MCQAIRAVFSTCACAHWAFGSPRNQPPIPWAMVAWPCSSRTPATVPLTTIGSTLVGSMLIDANGDAGAAAAATCGGTGGCMGGPYVVVGPGAVCAAGPAFTSRGSSTGVGGGAV